MSAIPESSNDKQRKAAAPDAAREITATRLFDAPRELVWKMWSDLHQLSRWWGPDGFTTTTQEFEFKPGGVWRHVMHGPDGTDYPNKMIYREIVEPERIGYSHVSAPLFESTVTFKAIGDKTEVSVRMVFESAELRDRVAKDFGAVEGLHQHLGNLDRALQQVQEASAAVTSAPLVIRRTFDASRELVFAAFTDAKQLARWWGPRGFSNPVCVADVRPGGEIRIDMRGPAGVTYPMSGRFREIVPPEKLVFTTTAFDDSFENLNTITFAEANGKTDLTLTVEVLRAKPEVFGALAGMKEGWSQSLDRLSETFVANETPGGEFVIGRVFDAPRELVWKAWTETDRMAQWFGPKGVQIVRSNNDLRAGGTYHYGMKTPDGQVMWGRWVYRDVIPPERLVFVNSFSDENGGITRHPGAEQWPLEMLTTVEFAEEAGKTRLTIRWAPLNATAEEKATFDKGRASMTGGWSGTFEQLEAYLDSASI